MTLRMRMNELIKESCSDSLTLPAYYVYGQNSYFNVKLGFEIMRRTPYGFFYGSLTNLRLIRKETPLNKGLKVVIINTNCVLECNKPTKMNEYHRLMKYIKSHHFHVIIIEGTYPIEQQFDITDEEELQKLSIITCSYDNDKDFQFTKERYMEYLKSIYQDDNKGMFCNDDL